MIASKTSGRPVLLACLLLLLGESALAQRSNDANEQGRIDRANASAIDRQRVPDQRSNDSFSTDREEALIYCWNGQLVRYLCPPNPAEAKPEPEPEEVDPIVQAQREAARAEEDEKRRVDEERAREARRLQEEYDLRAAQEADRRRTELWIRSADALESVKQRWDARSVLPSQLALENELAQFYELGVYAENTHVTHNSARYLQGLSHLEMAEESRIRGDSARAAWRLANALDHLWIACFNDGVLEPTPVAAAAQGLITRLAARDSPYRDLLARDVFDEVKARCAQSLPAAAPPHPDWFYDLDARSAVIREMVEREAVAGKAAYETTRAEEQRRGLNELLGIADLAVEQLLGELAAGGTGLPSQQGHRLDAIQRVRWNPEVSARGKAQAKYLFALFHLEMAEEQRLRGDLEGAANNLGIGISSLVDVSIDYEHSTGVVSVDGAARQLYGLVTATRGPYRTLLATPIVTWTLRDAEERISAWAYRASSPPGAWEYDLAGRLAGIREMVKRDR